MKNFWLHLRIVLRHKWHVFLACRDCGLLWRGIKHDLSKFAPIEFLSGVRYFRGTKSPIEAEKEDKGYSCGWQHHKGRNTHHWEYWLDFKDSSIVPIRMPYEDVIENVCDRVGATKAYYYSSWTQDMPLAYWDKNKCFVVIHPDTAQLIESSLKYIKNHGWGEYAQIVRSTRLEY